MVIDRACGFPRCQVAGAGAEAGAMVRRRLLRGTNAAMLALPPIMLVRVAVGQCPGAGWRHVALVWAGFHPMPCVQQ